MIGNLYSRSCPGKKALVLNRFMPGRRRAHVAVFIVLSCLFFQVPEALSFLRFGKGKLSAKHETFPVHLVVDFGSAGKQGYDSTLLAEKEMNAIEAVGQVYPILYGMACCSMREIVEINGVRIDPAENRWWKATLNGSTKFSPRKKKLKRGDRLEWHYIEETQ